MGEKKTIFGATFLPFVFAQQQQQHNSKGVSHIRMKYLMVHMAFKQQSKTAYYLAAEEELFGSSIGFKNILNIFKYVLFCFKTQHERFSSILWSESILQAILM